MSTPSIKTLPVKVVEELQPFLQERSDYFIIANPNESYLLKYLDVDNKSSFFFEITTYNIHNGAISFQIKHRPGSEVTINAEPFYIQASQVSAFLKKWESILKKYAVLQNPYNYDPIVKQYEEEYYSDFEIIEDNADIHSFNEQQQLFIDKYLEHIIVKLEKAKAEYDNKDIEEIKKDVDELRNEQTKLTKRQVIKKLSHIWAKTRKLSIKLLKEITNEAIKETIKAMVKGQIDNSHLLETAKHFISGILNM